MCALRDERYAFASKLLTIFSKLREMLNGFLRDLPKGKNYVRTLEHKIGAKLSLSMKLKKF